jgi:predicted nicotinamide N-methyase
MGRFDLIIAGDVLYERDHPTLLSSTLARHAEQASAVVIADPGRQQRSKFRSVMQQQGYAVTTARTPFPPLTHDGHILTCTRTA